MRATVYFPACCPLPRRRGGIRTRHLEGPSRPCGVVMLDHMSELIENRFSQTRRVTKGWVTRGKAAALHGTYEGNNLCNKAAEDPEKDTFPRWMRTGWPVGIEEPVTYTGVFPATEEDTNAVETSKTFMADADLERL